MLYLHLDCPKNIMLYPGTYFDSNVNEDWLTTIFAKTVAMELSHMEHIAGEVYRNHWVHKTLGPRELAGGVKSLILLEQNIDRTIPTSTMGDNCFTYVLELANVKDIHLWVNSYVGWPVPDYPVTVVTEDGSYTTTAGAAYLDTVRRWNTHA